MTGQHRVAVAREQHQIGFPVACLAAPGGGLGALVDACAALEGLDRTAAAPTQPPPPVLGARQQPVPVVLLRRAVIDEPVDGLVADERATLLERQPAGDLLRRSSHRKVIADIGPQVRLARQLVARVPAPPSPGQPIGPLRLVAARPLFRELGIALQLAADCRGRSAKPGCNRTFRETLPHQQADLAALPQGKL